MIQGSVHASAVWRSDDNRGEDVGRKGGVFKATAGLYEQFGEERVMDTPLAESAIAGVGIGAAMYGMRPIGMIQGSVHASAVWRSDDNRTAPVIVAAVADFSRLRNNLVDRRHNEISKSRYRSGNVRNETDC